MSRPHAPNRPSFPLRPVAWGACLLAVLATAPAHADERAELEQLRATTLGLIQALVDNGLLGPEKAQALIQQAERGRSGAAGAAPAGVAGGAAGGAVAGAVAGAAAANAAGAGSAGAAGTAGAARNVVRVPYVPESVKNEMREQIKQEVLAQARTERWGEPGALPDWLGRWSLDADVRVRWEQAMFASDNFPVDYAGGETFADQYASPAFAPDITNTTNDRSRLTLRARLGATGQLGEGWSAGLRVATGSNSSPVSTSQTLGGGSGDFNKYSIWLDRGYVQWAPAISPSTDGRLVLGRFANPWYGTDLTWPSDLNFDGVAGSIRFQADERTRLFATAGLFPLQEFEISGDDKWLTGLQIGGEFNADRMRFKVGLAYYDFDGIEGEATTEQAPANSGTAYLTSEYPKGVRQKGNSLIRLNPFDDASGDPLNPVWGLASKFRPIDLTFGATFLHFQPYVIRAGLDYVKNTAFDVNDIRARAISPDLELKEKTSAYQASVGFGTEKLDKRGDWQAGFSWRRLERDAWPDAFTDTTWHLGGTNYDGWQISGSYGVGPLTSLGLRWTSTRNLDDGSTLTSNGTTNFSNAPLKIDVLQIELNSRF